MAETSFVLIAANIPEFKNQGVLWFRENESKIKALRAKNLWWRNRIQLLEKDLKINPLTLIRELADFGYAKTSRVLNPGEMSFLGARLVLWPINLDAPVAVDFDGNIIESIQELEKPKLRSDLVSRSDLD